ncbi:aromatic amino acid lyase, partial [Dickeya sp. DW 0440]
MSQTQRICLTPGAVDLATLRAIYQGGVTLTLDASSRTAVQAAQQTVQHILRQDRVVYGINTGFGKLAQTRIAPERLAELQRNLVLSHCAGIGALLADEVVRLVIATKIISLARGHSGVRLLVVDTLLALFNAGVMPCIPEKGSVGASGDLAPLAHLALLLLGEGQARVNGEFLSAQAALAHAGVAPLVLEPKEGLALLNGTQVSTALALRGLFESEKVFAAALVAGALSLEAIKGSVKPFDARIHQARGQQGQIAVAAAVSELLAGSEILCSHAACGRVQDPYSIRCIPQVMGACLDNVRHA